MAQIEGGVRQICAATPLPPFPYRDQRTRPPKSPRSAAPLIRMRKTWPGINQIKHKGPCSVSKPPAKTRKPPPSTQKPVQRLRISEEMRTCITLMAEEGLPLPVAAERAGITRDRAVHNMHKPHIKRLLNQKIKEIRDNAAQEAYLRINRMAQTTDSGRLAFDANRWVAGVDGIAPVQKVHGTHQHNHAFQGFEYPTLDAKDVTPTDGTFEQDDD